ncbi:hypothetical protein CASFOL_019058 [Castilleja foliolosa]|uniref:Peptidase M48 domain-containing protein n=1 Tax=Castilleja foliolosa TaxID=1961234 RepID=A0ABD3D6C2_9LAMI
MKIGAQQTFEDPACAYDTALFYLRGQSARLNFTECVFEDGAVVDEMRDLSAAAIRQKATEVGPRVDALEAAGPKKSGRAYEKPDLNESDIAILVAANTGNMELCDLRNEAVDKWHKEDKIVVFTALLEHFLTDPEVATIIGHEVGHAS